MQDSRRVELDDSVEYLFGALFGAETQHTFSRTRSLTRWRKDLVGAFRAINAAMELNLGNADQLLRRELEEYLRLTVTELKGQADKDKLNTRALCGLIRIIFLILGGLPNHRCQRRRAPRRSWKLDAHRSLIYVHSERQRAQLLRSTLSEDQRFKAPLNDAKMIAWFKHRFPDRYAEVF